MLGAALPAPRRSRFVSAELRGGKGTPLKEMMELQKEAQVVEQRLESNDLAVVVEPGRRLYGRVCVVQWLDQDAVEVLPVQDVGLGVSDLSVELRFKRKRGGGAGGCPEGQGLKRRDVARMCWPCLREPPQPMTEKHLIEQDWRQHSTKRFSPGRVHNAWREMDGQTRRKYRQLSARAEEIYQQMLLARFHVFNLIKELITLAPGPQLNGYFLYCQKCKREGKEALPAWNEAKEEFDELARAENAKLRTERALFLEVCLGEGWTKQRSKFFPRSTLKCMRTLLLCHQRSGGISQHVWVEHIFPFIPCYWFAKVS